MSKFVSSKCNRFITCENAERKRKQAKSSFPSAERKLSLVMVNTISAIADGMPRKRGVDTPPRYPVHPSSVPVAEERRLKK